MTSYGQIGDTTHKALLSSKSGTVYNMQSSLDSQEGINQPNNRLQ